MTDANVLAPATHGQPSRKGKKAWRKNVDITEVQKGLEDAREEIIKTGGVIAEKPTDELFATDVLGDEVISKQQQGKKLLKADEIIALRSAVPGLNGRKRKAAETTQASSKKQKNGKYISHKELQRLRAVADGANVDSLAGTAATHDPWAEPASTANPALGFLEESRPAREPSTLKHAPKTLTVNRKSLPNVRRPDAGKSYNPRLQDWEALLEREGLVAVEDEKQRLAAKAAAEGQEARAAQEAAKVEAAEKDEYATDYDSAWESEWDGFQSEPEQEVHTKKQRGRMTPAERNKVKARKLREAKEVHDKKMKAREAQEKRIKQIAKEVSAKDKARQAHAHRHTAASASDSSDDDGVRYELQRRGIGQAPVPDAPLEVVLPDELEGSLRRLKPEGNLMQERYRNLLVNGKIETRRRAGQQKQAKTTRSEKWSYKDWRLE